MRISSELGVSRVVDDCVYDSGASNGNYIGVTALRQMQNYDELDFQPCRHVARLGDSKTVVSCSKTVVLTVSPIDEYGDDCDGIVVELLARAARKPLQLRLGVGKVMSKLGGLCPDLEGELGRYNVVKDRAMNHPDKVHRVLSGEDGSVSMFSMLVLKLVVFHSSEEESYDSCVVSDSCEACCCKWLVQIVWYRVATEQQSTQLEWSMFGMQKLEFTECEQIQRKCQKNVELLRWLKPELGFLRYVIQKSVVQTIAEYASMVLSLSLFSFLSFYPTLHLSLV